MSPPWATTSSFFCVVWAWAEPGSACDSAPAAPRATAPLSISRRVTSIGMHLHELDRAQLAAATAVCGDVYRAFREACQACHNLINAVVGDSSAPGANTERERAICGVRMWW